MIKTTLGQTNGSGYHPKVTASGGFSIQKNRGWGIYIVLMIHSLLLGLVFAFRILGLISDYVLVIIMAAVSLEAIYFALFTQLKTQRIAGNLKEIQGKMDEICQEASEMEKTHRSLLYFGHQIKSIQENLDAFKKGRIIKPLRNGHRIQKLDSVSQSTF